MMMNYKTLVVASLMSITLISAAFAQCVQCAIYPDRDPLNNGALTPAGKMGLVRPGSATGSSSPANIAKSANEVNNARAQVRNRHLRGSSRGSGVDGNPVRK
jgi:hypothetical protein